MRHSFFELRNSPVHLCPCGVVERHQPLLVCWLTKSCEATFANAIHHGFDGCLGRETMALSHARLRNVPLDASIHSPSSSAKRSSAAPSEPSARPWLSRHSALRIDLMSAPAGARTTAQSLNRARSCPLDRRACGCLEKVLRACRPRNDLRSKTFQLENSLRKGNHHSGWLRPWCLRGKALLTGMSHRDRTIFAGNISAPIFSVHAPLRYARARCPPSLSSGETLGSRLPSRSMSRA